ncbi:MAG: LysE family translocator [Pseudomonas sp.]|uniref:LysE family translocator n=1 Tax=Pseudomonas sp. TaxID=306 RepID=UPI003391EBFB
MELAIWFTFLLSIMALIAFPGPSAILVVQTARVHGVPAAFSAIAGGCVAAVLLLLAALVGLAQLAPEGLLEGLKVCGGFYLVYLGVTSLKQRPADVLVQTGSRRFFTRAFFTGISNPKDIIYFTTFLSLFIPKNPHLGVFVLVIGTWVVVDSAIMACYALFASRQNLPGARYLNTACALVLVMVGSGFLLSLASRGLAWLF